MLEARAALTQVVCDTEKELEMDRYLAPLPAGLPQSMQELSARAATYLAEHPERAASFPKVYAQLETRLRKPQPPDSRIYRSAREQGLAMMREAVRGLFEVHRLDALVYLTRTNLPDRVSSQNPSHDPATLARLGAGSFRNIANLTGFPDLVVPAGRNLAGLPVSISFLGLAWSEPRLLALGHAFEQATLRRFDAAATPALPGETFEYFSRTTP